MKCILFVASFFCSCFIYYPFNVFFSQHVALTVGGHLTKIATSIIMMNGTMCKAINSSVISSNVKRKDVNVVYLVTHLDLVNCDTLNKTLKSLS